MTTSLETPTKEEVVVPSRAPAHVSSLDGVRMIAVFAVMAVHAGAPGCDLGWLGVDIFFVLSGFLITTLLVREYEQRGSISLLRFWCRRALRLMPAYWLYVGCITIMLLSGIGWSARHGGWSPATYLASLWGYFVNVAPMGGVWQHQMLTIHLWSLAVEEQFYLVWPALCWLLLLWRPRSAALAAWGLVLGVVAYRHFAPDAQLDHLLYTRGIGIVMGCAIALTCASVGSIRSIAGYRGLRLMTPVIIAIAVAVLTALTVRSRIDKPFLHRYAIPPLDAMFAVMIAMLWYGPHDALAKALAWRPVAYLGKISYGLYLYHMAAHELVWGPLLGGIEHWQKVPKFGLRVGVFFLLSIAIASLSYHWIERPFLKLKDRVR